MKLGRLHQAALAACLALASGLCAPFAGADEKPVLAQEAFDQAMKLAKVGNYAEACPKFEESQKLDPQIGTLFFLADCQEHMELRASAWANFVAAGDKAAAVNKPAHAAAARARADALKVRLNKLLILLPEEIRRAPGFEIKKGDIVLGPSQVGAAFAVDNGKHVIQVKATGRRTWATTVEVAGEGSTITVSVPILQEEPVVGPVATAIPTASPSAPPDTGWSTPRKVALGLGVAGVAGLVAGAVFGGLAIDRSNAAAPLCQAGAAGQADECLPEGGKARDDARMFAGGANVGLIAGGVLAAGGLVLWLVAPASDTAAAPAGPAARKKPSPAKVSFRVGVTDGGSGAAVQFGQEW